MPKNDRKTSAPAPAAPPTPEDLVAVAKARSQTCLEEINAVLAKHRCSIGCQPFIDVKDGSIQAQWGVLPQ